MDSKDITSIIISSVAILSALALLSFWVHRRTEVRKIEVQSRAALVDDGRLRELVDAGLRAQQATTAELAKMQAGFADLQTRLATIEKLLRDVDA